MAFNSFRTISVTDSDYQDYLWSRGSATRGGSIPLPIKTLNLGSKEETVTFQLFAKHEIQKPSFLVFFVTLVKLHTFTLVMLPLFYVLVKNFVDDRLRDPVSICFAAIGMMFFYAAMNIRNDVFDHVNGFDRVNVSTSNKPISLGWISASKALILSWVLFAVSFVVTIPAFILQTELIRVLAVCLLLLFMGHFFQRNSYKSNRFGEVILFILSGAGVASGYQVALGGGVDTEVLAFGVFWGVGILFLIYVNNFSHLLTSYQAGLVNSITRLGFDKAKVFLVAWWAFFCVLWTIYHILYASTIWTIFGTILLVFWSMPLMVRILQTKSPLGSDLVYIRKQSHRTFLVMVMIIFSEYMWYLVDKLNWMPS